MKRNYILISMIVALLLAHPLFSQPTYNLKISNIENEAVGGGNFDLTIQIQAASDSFGMGTSNLVLSFNPNALSQPTLLEAYNFSGGTFYNEITVTEPDTGWVSTNIELFAPLQGDKINEDFMDIVRIRFWILDLNENADINWRIETPNPTVVFVDDATFSTIATQGELDGFDIVLSVENSKPGLPQDYSLGQNYPNPFNPTTQIQFQVAQQTDVKLAIFNLLGQKVRTLVASNYQPGFYNVTWDGRDNQGNLRSSGVYIYQLRAGNFLETRRMVLLK